MTHVQDFNPSLAFVSKSSSLSNVKPLQQFESKPSLSLALAYMYAVMRYNKPVLVQPELYDLLVSLFPKLVNANDSGIEGITISIVDTALPNPKYREGLLLMPVYVSETSTIVYNIHPTSELDEMEYTTEAVRGALNFFNSVVRSPTSGTGRVIWKDPVVFSTLLQSANYDRMFALWLANSYLSMFPDQYPTNDARQTLAMAIRLLELLEEGSEAGARQVQMTERAYDETMLDALIVPAVVAASTEVEVASAATVTDQSKADPFAVLFYLRKYTPEKRMPGLNLYLTGFSNYAFLSTLTKMYPKVRFIVYGKPSEVSTVPKAPNTSSVNKVLTAAVIRDTIKAKTKLALFSKLRSNDALLVAFEGEAVALAGTTTYVPVETYCSVFSGASPVAWSVFDGPRKKDAAAATEIKERVKLYTQEIAREYRDTRRWAYTLDDATLSYDEASLRWLQR